jgi:hypothetical protein
VRLGPGQRAVPVQVIGSDLRAYLGPGARIDLIAVPADRYGTGPAVSSEFVAQGVVVLKVVPPAGGLGGVSGDTAGAELIIAVDAATALRIAECITEPCLAAVDDSP